MILLMVIPSKSQENVKQQSNAQNNADTATCQNVVHEGFWRKAEEDPVAAFTGVLALFTVLLVAVSVAQIRFLIRADKTARDTAVAALSQARIAEATFRTRNRPYVFIESMTYEEEETREGKILVTFKFTVQNFGEAPAIVRHIVAFGFLSSGKFGARAKDTYPAVVFPSPEELAQLLGDRASVRVFPQVRPDVLEIGPLKMGYRYGGKTMTLRSGCSGPLLTHFVKDAVSQKSDNMHDVVGEHSRVAHPWLLGLVTYEDFLGNRYETRFCFRGRGDGIAEEEYGRPYNERT